MIRYQPTPKEDYRDIIYKQRRIGADAYFFSFKTFDDNRTLNHTT